ncbi:hypothetical protein COCCADRAFT_103171 [Bipolaris zeicola 26-R-13]|uniref:Uncharacterized protein n=1 Tax=Cochliobolus carbonum (strain 26-R-13) TaxID=930089 RepID=W6XYC1_COCC2|nr:uncharacterized protein COCCADRAFT_103171 [Bipolaris zeicola 26-R-13]EUC30723.1 hypothetical protein COCCADRAFT_103171 [Bipolaris zeicola 26-R-13]
MSVSILGRTNKYAYKRSNTQRVAERKKNIRHNQALLTHISFSFQKNHSSPIQHRQPPTSLSTMKPTTLLFLLASTSSAWIVKNCRGNLQHNWSAGRCYNYDVGTSLMYQSNNKCQITFYESDDFTGVGWGSKSQDKCLGLPGNVRIRGVRWDE